VRFRATPSGILLAVLVAALALGVSACGRDDDEESGGDAPAAAETDTAAAEDGGEALSGTIEADGSSTVGPLVTAAAEQFQGENPDVQITVGISGTGGGFERFCAGETDLSDASRPIADDEVPVCEEAGIDFTEFRVATDALTVVVNKDNDWVDCLTVEQLNTIWGPEAEGQITSWNQVDPSFPDEPLALAGPGTDSGTFDYFTDVINGEEGASRADFTASEDDNTTVQAVSSERGGLGYFGFSYYEENQDTLKALQVDGGGGCVEPSVETAQDGTYTPLARPLFVYAKNESLQRPEVNAFIHFIFDNNTEIAETAQFVPLTDEQLEEARSAAEQALG
jgi:phosphate transport system substrate-binding protein